jgi:outer membrane protein OmpA-like peptidoglycan-associated protein
MNLEMKLASAKTFVAMLQALVLAFVAVPVSAQKLPGGAGPGPCEAVITSMPHSNGKITVPRPLTDQLCFPSGGAQLIKASMPAVNQIADLWRAQPQRTLALSVKADPGMRPAQGNALAKQRADSLTQAFRAAGVDPRKIQMTPILVGRPPTE